MLYTSFDRNAEHNLSAALESYTSWSLVDVGAMLQAAQDQQLPLDWGPLQAIPLLFEQTNDLLLNIMCDESYQWAL